MVGDGFGGRSWYMPHNYQVGAYSAYTICDSNNQVYGWGNNSYGELGNGTTNSTFTPVAAVGMNNVKFYTTGYMSAAIKNDNTAWMWGFGYPVVPNSSVVPIQILTNAKFVDAGSSHIVIVKNDGTVWALGRNQTGQLGTGTTFTATATPVQMIGVNNAVRAVALGFGDLSVGEYYPPATLILLSDGTLKITGGYSNGEAWFSDSQRLVPAPIPTLTNIVDIKGGAIAAFALNANGEVYSFGREDTTYPSGSLGLGVDTSVYHYKSPTKVIFPAGASPVIALSVNNDGYHTFALTENGDLYGWGRNDYGQLGIGTSTYSPTPILLNTAVVDIFAGETFSYILKSNGTLWATGRSGYSTNYGSIWMNLFTSIQLSWTQIQPTISPMNLCSAKGFGVVPIKLISFNCKAHDKSALITWQSASEENADKYNVEYSSDGNSFKTLTAIKARGTNSSYSYVHSQVNGIAFYRLKMIDKDGAYKYSQIRSLKFYNTNQFTIVPNPAKDYININNNTNIKSLEVLSISGEVLKTLKNITNQQQINIADLTKGVYFLRAIDKNGNLLHSKMIKL